MNFSKFLRNYLTDFDEIKINSSVALSNFLRGLTSNFH